MQLSYTSRLFQQLWRLKKIVLFNFKGGGSRVLENAEILSRYQILGSFLRNHGLDAIFSTKDSASGSVCYSLSDLQNLLCLPRGGTMRESPQIAMPVRVRVTASMLNVTEAELTSPKISVHTYDTRSMVFRPNLSQDREIVD